jgi:hypothetical protein
MANSSSARRPRFRRCADNNIPAIQVTPRDTEMIRQISTHRFLRSPQIAALVGGSDRHVLRRLQLLYHHGYLERPRAQIDSYHRAGSQPIAYGLAGRGAAHLRRVLDLPFDRIDWTRKNGGVSRLFLDHALMTSEIMVGFETTAREQSGVC